MNDASGRGYNYKAPTVGYADVLFAHGTPKAGVLFGTATTRLARYVSVQSWIGVTIMGKAMEDLADPPLIKPLGLGPNEDYDDTDTDVIEVDPADPSKKVTVKKKRPSQGRRIPAS